MVYTTGVFFPAFHQVILPAICHSFLCFRFFLLGFLFFWRFYCTCIWFIIFLTLYFRFGPHFLSGVLRFRALHGGRALRPGAAGLLNDVGQLVGQQQLAPIGFGGVLALPEHRVLPDREGFRSDSLCRLRRPGISVNPHLAEVMSKPRFEECASGWGQWLTR